MPQTVSKERRPRLPEDFERLSPSYQIVLVKDPLNSGKTVWRLPSESQAAGWPVSHGIKIDVSADGECQANRQSSVKSDLFLVSRASDSEGTEKSSAEPLNATGFGDVVENGGVREARLLDICNIIAEMRNYRQRQACYVMMGGATTGCLSARNPCRQLLRGDHTVDRFQSCVIREQCLPKLRESADGFFDMSEVLLLQEGISQLLQLPN